ncbi:hypothetical protein ACWD5R_45435 [Streptomyces sp. NPDC002514]|uniref:hypothetical protein n=1 Tax=Streptomyces sp. NPDC001270 TaxID=3364554 RepID=UPI003685E077
MSSQIDRVLAKARLENSIYLDEDTEMAERRIAARVADRLLHGALRLDDAMQTGLAQAFRPPRGDAPWQPEEKLRIDAAGALRALSRGVVGQADALHQMANFVAHRLVDTDGATVLGCVLQLAAREDSARFWWQFAAGAGDPTAACYLHHLSLGETREADLWRAQMIPDRSAESIQPYPDPWPGWDGGSPTSLGGWTLLTIGMEDRPPTATVTLRHVVLPEAAAVVSYVPTAIEYVDDVGLFLPTDGFAERIEELTASQP